MEQVREVKARVQAEAGAEAAAEAREAAFQQDRVAIVSARTAAKGFLTNRGFPVAYSSAPSVERP